MTSLAWKLARRELRHNPRFALAFVANLALGLLGFLTLDAYKVSVENAIRSRSKALLAADLSVSGRRDLTRDEERLLLATVGPGAGRSRVIEFFTMAAVGTRSRLVQVKAIEPSYPFYGELTLGSGGPPDVSALPATNRAWVSAELLAQLGSSLGEELKLGDARFAVVDTVTQDPASVSSFLALAPKVYLHVDQLARTGLLRPGSSVSYSHLFRLPESTDGAELARELNRLLPDPGLRIQTHESASDQVGRVAKYLGDYLGLVTLVAFFLASLGAAYLFRSYVTRRSREIAVLRALGVGSRQAIACYALQLVALGALAVPPAAAGSALLLPVVTRLLQVLFPFSLAPALSWRSVVVAAGLSTLGSLFICLPILVRIGRLRPGQLFGESDVSLPPSRRDALWVVPSVVFYGCLAVWQAKSWLVGIAFLIALVVSTLLLTLLGAIGLRIVEAIPWRSLLLRLPARQLARQKVATLSCLLALSLGTLLVNFIAQLQTSLRAELEAPETGKLPAFFLFDIQQEQRDPLLALLRDHGASTTQVSPLVRARLSAVNGKPFEKAQSPDEASTREEEAGRRFRNRGINLTYRDRLSDSEEIVAGADFSSEVGAAKISVERDYARRMGFRLGDTLTFDVQGVDVQATIANFRRVRWTSFQPNFFIQFAPGVIDEAPQTFLASVAKLSPDDKLRLQAALVEKFPNVSPIDVAQVVERILSILEQMSWALRFMAYLALAAGLVVLYSVASHQTRLRRWDTALLKTLGAGFGDIRKMALVEFGVTGALAASFGVVGSVAMSLAFSRLLFDNRWVFAWDVPLASLIVLTGLSMLVAFAATHRTLAEKPIVLLQGPKAGG